METVRSSESGWRARHFALATVLVAGAVAASWNAWSDLLFIARKDEESSHVFLVPLAFLWIFSVRRDSSRKCRPAGLWIGPAFITLGWLLWSGGYRFDIQAFWHGGAVLMAVGAALTIFGIDVLRRFWPAFIVLLFLVPVPGSLRQEMARPMQTITAQATQSVAELFGMNVERWGNTLALNGTQIAVAEACNGMRMVFTLFLVSFTFAFITPLRGYVRFLIIAASPLTAIFCNVLRLVPTVWVYGSFSRSTAEAFHQISGWIMLVVGFLMLMGVVKVLRWLMIPVGPAPSQRSEITTMLPSRHYAVVPFVTACLLLAGAGADRLTSPATGDAVPYLKAVRVAADATPLRLGRWLGKDVPVPASAVTLLRPNALLSREYVDLETGRKATFLLVHCADARDILGHYPPVCYPSAGWVEQSREPKQWTVNGKSIPGFEYRFAAAPASGQGSLVVMNTMLLPDGAFHEDMTAVRKTAARLRRRSWGAGQIQILVDESLSPAERDDVFVAMVQLHWRLLKAILDSSSAGEPGTMGEK